MRRFLPPILVLLMLLTALPGALATQAPHSPGPWEVADVRTLESGEDEYVALSPDGTQVAGIGADGGLCVWQVESMEPSCAEDVGAIRVESITWSPDSTAVAFSLDHILLLVESDIFVYESAAGALHNLTDDGHEGPIDTSEPGTLVDGMPAWSPDSRELVFVRSHPADETFGTVIMRIDRAGGEPIRVHRLPLESPYGIFMPMHWLPDDSLLYTQVSLDGTEPSDGVWRVGLDGGDARHLLPGARGTDTPGPVLMDVSPEAGLALAYVGMIEPPSPTTPERMLVWLLDIETGEATPVPNLPPPSGEAPELSGRAQAAAFSPDGSAFMGVYSSYSEGTILAVTDVAIGGTTVLADDLPARAASALPTWAGEWFFLPARAQATLVTLAAPAGASATPAASPDTSPVASEAGWRIADWRELPIKSRHVAMSPDGVQLAGLDSDGLFCLWVTETLVSTCVEERLPIREETITWSPDGTAVAFALDAIRMMYESDIYIYEVASGELRNLTDDGVEGDVIDALDADAPIDDVPAWSPDGQRIAFARSHWGADDDPGSTSIMVIDRAGGEPVELLPLDIEEPLAIWMPMHWLQDGTLLYSQIARELEDPRNGVWKIGVDDGASPLQVVPGSEETEIPGPWISDADGDHALVHSYWLMGRVGYDPERPLFWLVDAATGERVPLLAPGGGAWFIDAGFSPDGVTALLVAATSDGARRLVLLDIASGEIVPLDAAPRDTLFTVGTPQWAANDTVLFQTPAGPVLLTLELAS